MLEQIFNGVQPNRPKSPHCHGSQRCVRHRLARLVRSQLKPRIPDDQNVQFSTIRTYPHVETAIYADVHDTCTDLDNDFDWINRHLGFGIDHLKIALLYSLSSAIHAGLYPLYRSIFRSSNPCICSKETEGSCPGHCQVSPMM